MRLAAAVNHYDPMIDQLLAIKQAAWLFRSTSGEASLLLASGLTVGHMTPEARLNYTRFVGGIETAWTGLEQLVTAGSAPKSLIDAMAMAKTANFDPQYLALRDRIANALLSGEKPELTASQWSPITVGRMGSAVTVAERALDEAKSTSFGAAVGGGAIADFPAVPAGGRARSRLGQHDRRSAAASSIRCMPFATPCCRSRRAIFPSTRDMPNAVTKSARLPAPLPCSSSRRSRKRKSRSRNGTEISAALARQQAIEAHIAAFEDQMRLALNASGYRIRSDADDLG